MSDVAVQEVAVDPQPVVARRRRWPMNPVLERELRIRLRGKRGWMLLTFYLVLLAIIVFVAYTSQTGGFSDDPFSTPSPTRFASMGRTVFEWVLLFMLLLVLFLVPGFTSGAIAGERERQTLVPLQITLMRPWQIVTGKLLSSFAFLALLVVATAPFLAVAYLIGGVTMGAVLRGVGVVLFTGLALSAVTICCSAVFRRVQIATVVAYAVVLALVVGTALVALAAAVIDDSRGTDQAAPPVAALLMNPILLTADVLSDDRISPDVSSPFDAFDQVIARAEFGVSDVQRFAFEGGFDPAFPVDGDIGIDIGVGGGDGPAIIGFDENGNPVVDTSGTRFPFWAKSAIGLYTLAAVAGVVAVRRLRTPAERER